jgi:hypothetical protein
MPLTSKEDRVYHRLSDVEPVPHGYGYRWRFCGSREPVTAQIRSMQRKGLIEVREMAFGPDIFINTETSF